MRISFITATYNDEGFIKEFFDSMRYIVKDGDEMLIIDDKSTDNTLNEIEKYREKLPIRLIKNATNIGMPKNCNKCMEEARNEVIAWSDVDYYYPNKGYVIREHLTKAQALIHTSYFKNEDYPYTHNLRLVEATENFDYRGKSKIQMSTVVEWKKNAIKYPFNEKYKWHNLYFERFLRMKMDRVNMKPVNAPTTRWNRRVGNYDRHKHEIAIVQDNIYKEYGLNL